MAKRPVGLHTKVSGGLLRAVARAEATGCDALQVFPSNPRGWAVPDPDPVEEEAFATACDERGWPRFVHAPYLVNLAAPDAVVFRRSCDSLAFALRRAVRFGAVAVVVHAGSTVGSDRREARRRAAGALRRLLDATPGSEVAVELTAGGGERSLARRVGDVAEFLVACDGDERVGVCLDTCHLWAAGADWTTAAGLRALRAEVRELGVDRIRVVHVNDSNDHLGSSRDHHANLGVGAIGAAAFGPFVRAPEWRHAPLICETPGTEERRAADVATVRAALQARRTR